MNDPRVILELNNDIRNSKLSIVNRFCKIFSIEKSYSHWKGLTVEVFELFIDGNRVGKISVFW